MNSKIIKTIGVTILSLIIICSPALAQRVTNGKITITGTVTCEGTPLAGVPVSDGYEITTTDDNGQYSLSSQKRHGYVFITQPSGYEVPVQRTTPGFWSTLTQSIDSIESHDFHLKKVDNKNHAMIAITDLHLSNLYNDKEQFCLSFLPDIQRTINRMEGKRIYTLCLGDMSFDLFWYSHKYDINDYRNTMNIVNYPTPIYHVIGNHDHDGATAYSDSTDFLSAEKYKRALGPTYYSFNIGNIHYVVLDDIIYKNEPGGKKGTNIVGKRNYDNRVTAEQLEWLKKDLALIKDKSTPVVIAMHAPVYRYDGISSKVISWMTRPEYSEELSQCFTDFKEVHFLDGHTHSNNTTRYQQFIDHNIGAVCGSWWQTSANYFQNLCPDGSPAGYSVFTSTGKNLSWYYQSIGEKPEYQFCTFDMNEVRNYYLHSPEVATFLEHYPSRTDFRKIKENKVLIHIWGWEPQWKVEVSENSKLLNVQHEQTENPLYTISHDIPETVGKDKYPKNYQQALKNHLFMVETSSPTSTLKIKVTDAFGNTYTETMIRPKAFTCEMK